MKLTHIKNNDWDALLVTIKRPTAPSYQHYEGLTTIVDDGEIVGLNIFNASTRLDLPNRVDIPVTPLLINAINSILDENSVSALSIDTAPKFVVGNITDKRPHPDADKLSVCQVNVGAETLQIVCGAPNVDTDQNVVVARVGAVMPNGLYIGESELRGVSSYGMICSRKELHLPEDGTNGIYVLNNDVTAGDVYEIH